MKPIIYYRWNGKGEGNTLPTYIDCTKTRLKRIFQYICDNFFEAEFPKFKELIKELRKPYVIELWDIDSQKD